MWQNTRQKKLNRKKVFRKRLDLKQIIWNLLKRMRSLLSSQNYEKRKMIKKNKLMLSLWRFDVWNKITCMSKKLNKNREISLWIHEHISWIQRHISRIEWHLSLYMLYSQRLNRMISKKVWKLTKLMTRFRYLEARLKSSDI
jgi:hypothetical protein